MSSDRKTVKVYNLTDIHTSNLIQRKLIDQHIAIAGRMCEPGQFVEVDDSPTLRADCKHLVAVGALSIAALPPPYLQARSAKESASGKLPVAHVQHLDIQETAVAGVSEAPPAADASAPVVPTKEAKSSNRSRQ